MKNREKKLVKNTAIIFIGTVGAKMISFLLLPLYTSTLTTAEYGAMELVMSIASLVIPIITLQLEQGLFRYLIDNKSSEENKKELISSSFALIIFNALLFTVIVLFISHIIDIPHILYFILISVAGSMSSMILQVSRGVGDNKTYSTGGIINAIFNIAFSVLFLVVLGYKTEGMLAAVTIGYVCSLIYVAIKIKIYKYISFRSINIKVLCKNLKYSLPMVPNQLSWWIFDASDRVIASIIIGVSATGMLAVSYKFSSAFIILYNIFDASWRESVIQHRKDSDIEDYFNNILSVVFNVFSAIGLLLIFFVSLVFEAFVGVEFSESYNLIPIAIMAAIAQVMVGLTSAVFLSKEDTANLAKTSIYAAVINALAHLIMINYIGVYAAVISTLLSNIFLMLYRMHIVNNKYIKIKVDTKNIFRFLILCSITLAAYYKFSYIGKSLLAVVMTAYMILYSRNTLLSALRVIKKRLKRS